MVDRMLTRCETTVDRRATVDSAAALRDRVSTLGSPHALRRADGGRSDGSDQARSDRCVTYLPSSAKVVTLSGNYSDFALILLDDALPAGTFQIAAELGRLFGGSERADHGAVIDPLVAEIGAFDDRRTGPQRGRKLVLQRAVGGLRVGLVLLRGDLNQITAAGRGSRLDGIGGGETGRRRRIGCWRALWRQRQRCVGAGIGGRWVTLGRSSWRGCRSGSGVRFCRCGRTRRDPTVLGGIALHGERLDLARLVVRRRAVRGRRQCRAGGRNARNQRRAVVPVQRRKYHKRGAGFGIDVNRRFVARCQLFTAAGRDAVGDLGGATIRLGRRYRGRG